MQYYILKPDTCSIARPSSLMSAETSAMVSLAASTRDTRAKPSASPSPSRPPRAAPRASAGSATPAGHCARRRRPVSRGTGRTGRGTARRGGVLQQDKADWSKEQDCAGSDDAGVLGEVHRVESDEGGVDRLRLTTPSVCTQDGRTSAGVGQPLNWHLPRAQWGDLPPSWAHRKRRAVPATDHPQSIPPP